MEKAQLDLYSKGYVAGYRAGMEDASRGKTIEMIHQDWVNLPIEALELSTRAYNCLVGAGCVYIADVLALSDQTISTMRNLGKVTASEIAHSLDAIGLRYSRWCNYL